MSTHVVRISKRSLYDLRELAAQLNESQQALIEAAVEEYKRKRMFEKANAVYAELRRNPEAWKEIEDERKAWDATLADGLIKE